MYPLIKQTNRWLDPFDLVTDLETDVGRLFASPWHREIEGGPGSYYPSLDMREDEHHYFLHLDIPGLERKDLTIEVRGNILTIKGERKEEEHRKGKGYFYSERWYGNFERSIELPMGVDAGKVVAHYKEGVLELTLPKSEKIRPKQIKVEVK